MEKYIALLRGINISGKNKISMSILKKYFNEYGFTNVITYINSGNIIFNSDIVNKIELMKIISNMIFTKFNLDIPVLVITNNELKTMLENSPSWWNSEDKELYNNLIFVIPPTTIEDVYNIIGEPKKEYEFIYLSNNVIYWSAYLKTFNKTNWNKIAASSVNNCVTIRNSNTLKKLLNISFK